MQYTSYLSDVQRDSNLGLQRGNQLCLDKREMPEEKEISLEIWDRSAQHKKEK
jgi:hypothetical protein